MNSKKQTKQDSSIPDSLLTRLYDSTGCMSFGTKGFLLFYVNDQGNPSVFSNTSNTCIDMALHKLVELYMTQPQRPNDNL